jgi:hypothetical protein
MFWRRAILFISKCGKNHFAIFWHFTYDAPARRQNGGFLPEEWNWLIRDRCCDFKKIYFCPKIGVFYSKYCYIVYASNWSKHWFSRKRHFFLRKLGEIAEICDHNIDPRSQVSFGSKNVAGVNHNIHINYLM